MVVEEQLTSRLGKPVPRHAAVPAVPFTPRLIEQVWRQPQHKLRESSDVRRLPTISQSMVAESPVRAGIDPQPVAATPASVSVPTKLEGPAMERLAEDVMRRIERHLRIERERRGI
jgi:hypothetical protein